MFEIKVLFQISIWKVKYFYLRDFTGVRKQATLAVSASDSEISIYYLSSLFPLGKSSNFENKRAELPSFQKIKKYTLSSYYGQVRKENE